MSRTIVLLLAVVAAGALLFFLLHGDRLTAPPADGANVAPPELSNDAELPIELSASPEREDIPSGGRAAGTQAPAEIPVAPGETFEKYFVIQAVQRGTGRPIFGARVRIAREKAGAATASSKGAGARSSAGRAAPTIYVMTTTEQGFCDVGYHPDETPRLRVDAAGFPPVIVVFNEGHESHDTAQEIVFTRGATLAGRVVDPLGQPLRGATVHLSVDPSRLAQPRDFSLDDPAWWQAPSWSAETDADGRCAFADLPAQAQIRVDIARPGVRGSERREPLIFQPGQEAQAEWKLEFGCTLRGRVLDERDRPVAKLGVVLGRNRSIAEANFVAGVDLDTFGRATSDASGKFEFANVPPGKWLVRPIAAVSSTPDAPKDVAGEAAPVEIAAGAKLQTVELRVHHDLRIRGIVLDAQGKPAPGAWVGATKDGETIPTTSTSGTDGAFAVGPLVPGRYSLVAALTPRDGRNLAPSAPFPANAGDGGIALRLKSGGTVRGRLVDVRTGAATKGEVLLGLRGSKEGGVFGGWSRADGTFDFANLEPGTYDLAARAAGPLSGMKKGLELVAGTEIKDLVLSLEPGATLRMSYEGDLPVASCRILKDGVIVATCGITSGTGSDEAVPAGKLSIERFVQGKGYVAVLTIDIVAGETKELLVPEAQ